MQPSHHNMLNKYLVGSQHFARYWCDGRDKMNPVLHRDFYLPIKQQWMLSVQWLFMWAILSMSFAFLCPVQEEQRSKTQKQKLEENSLKSHNQFSNLNLFLMPLSGLEFLRNLHFRIRTILCKFRRFDNMDEHIKSLKASYFAARWRMWREIIGFNCFKHINNTEEFRQDRTPG